MKTLLENGGKNFVGSGVTYIGIVMASFLDSLLTMAPEVKEKVPEVLMAHMESIKANEGVKAYLASRPEY